MKRVGGSSAFGAGRGGIVASVKPLGAAGSVSSPPGAEKSPLSAALTEAKEAPEAKAAELDGAVSPKPQRGWTKAEFAAVVDARAAARRRQEAEAKHLRDMAVEEVHASRAGYGLTLSARFFESETSHPEWELTPRSFADKMAHLFAASEDRSEAKATVALAAPLVTRARAGLSMAQVTALIDYAEATSTFRRPR